MCNNGCPLDGAPIGESPAMQLAPALLEHRQMSQDKCEVPGPRHQLLP